MKIRTVEMWPGHSATFFVVKKRRWPYRYFNWLFARARLPHEFVITGEERWNEELQYYR